MFKIGIGYDAHRFKRGRPLFLGGVRIPYPKGLDGHSDADVLIHAIVDALLGALGLPDIGHYFSNQDPKWENISSAVFLREIAKIVSQKKARILHIDSVLISERPKISPYLLEMKEIISKHLKVKPSAVGIKASTNEKMGFVGREEGMAATAVALIRAR